MSKYVHLTNGIVDFLMESDPFSVFSGSYAAEFMLVDNNEVGIGYYLDGVVFRSPAPIVKHPDEIKDEITKYTADRLDLFAKTRNYDSILSACTYAKSSVEQFAKEGKYCVDMRDATWGKLYQIMQEVEAGTRSMPSGYGDIESELPVLDWVNA